MSTLYTLSKLDHAKVYILYVGGTIGMKYKKKTGLVPIKGLLTKLVDDMKIRQSLNIDYKIERTAPLIDSSNLKVNNWYAVLKKLFLNYSKYDTFVIIHGTDTLAYTSSALSFFLRLWEKPVIITGSQIPLYEFRTDGKDNIINSIIVSLYKIPDVLVVFGNRIMRGNLIRKVNSTSFNAYSSPNYRDVGLLNVNINLDDDLIMGHIVPEFSSKLNDNWNLEDWNFKTINIYQFMLLPIHNGKLLEKLIDQEPEAIILRTYGIGNAPTGDEEFMKQLKRANKKKIIVVNCSQCLQGGVNMSYYKTGQDLLNLGVVSGYDMTPETIFGKLFFLFQVVGLEKSKREDIKYLLGKNLAGELPNTNINKNRKSIKAYFKTYQEL